MWWGSWVLKQWLSCSTNVPLLGHRVCQQRSSHFLQLPSSHSRLLLAFFKSFLKIWLLYSFLPLSLSGHEQACSEHRGNMKQTTGWPKSHRPGVCIVWEELTSKTKVRAGLLGMFLSPVPSPRQPWDLLSQLDRCFNNFFFPNMCILLNLKGDGLKMDMALWA